MNKTPLVEVFPELRDAELPRPFTSAFVTSVKLDRSKTRLEIAAEFEEAPSHDELAAVEKKLSAALGLSQVTLTQPIPAEATPTVAAATTISTPASPTPPPVKKSSAAKKSAQPSGSVIMGRAPTGSLTAMSDIDINLGQVTIEGCVFSSNSRTVKNGTAWVLSFDITDNTGSLHVSKFMRGDDARHVTDNIRTGMYLRVSGKLFLDRYENNDTVLDPVNIAVVDAPEKRYDNAPEKRVELHLHTKMSAMDALTDTAEVIKRAAEWGHTALAITDHGVAQSFPDAAHAAEAAGDMKIIYGVEGYYINDVDSRPAVYGAPDGAALLDGELVVFDIETTGLDSYRDKITEIAAVTIHNGEIISDFQTYVDPGMPIPREITELTGITDETVSGAPGQIEAVRAFLDYVGNRPLAAHNASFDLGFIYEVCFTNGIPFNSACLDTLTLSRAILPDLYNYKLPTVSSALRLPKFEHHHALADAKTTGLIAAAFQKNLKGRGLLSVEAINKFAYEASVKQRRRVNHIIILAKNREGLKNLYRLITDSHLEHFSRNPIIPKSLLLKHREGLLIGSACEAGEIFAAIERGNRFERHRLAEFYDYLEIQPISNNYFMLRGAKPRARDVEQLRNFNRSIVELGRETGRMVCATGDVHFLDPEDEIFRKILLNAKSFESALEDLPLYFRTTEEMLDEFSYLGEAACYEVVVTNTRAIAEMIESVSPLPPPKKLFAPKIDNSAEELKTLVFDRLRELYGETPPELVSARVEAELNDILGRGYDVIYITAQRLVRDSLDHGYLVGSRGSVGSSFVAYLAGITEVNSLPAHYRCPACGNADFESGADFGCGADMPDKLCPVCGAKYDKEGFDIPFETFLGFGGDKVPDIDLNFSGEYQAAAHKYTTELFGAEHVFRAGTIGTVAEKTAFGYVKKYLETVGKTVTRAEENRLAKGCVGVKRTTGQHP
ncbi:MAG: PolC-type DNA polymerase III, partial [Oscillospiraceae bacterium]|nr:PolC-type DNA polymerase III [Oscillospiraceae bacterium]